MENTPPDDPDTETTSERHQVYNSFEADIDQHLTNYYKNIFNNLKYDGFLTWDSRILAVGAKFHTYTLALRNAGLHNSKSTKRNVDLLFGNDTFDVVYSTHTGLVRTREIEVIFWSIPEIREIMMKKKVGYRRRRDVVGNCSVPAFKMGLIRKLEGLVLKEPVKRSPRKIKYLTSIVDISFKTRYVYIDVGAKNYGSSIGSWFNKTYPKQNKKFEIFAIEGNQKFHEEYKSRKKVTLLPYEAWVRNESLFFEINRDPSTKNEEKEYGIPETLHPELPGPGDRIVDFPKGKVGVYTSKRPGKNTPQCYTKPLDSLKNWNNRFFWVDGRVFPTVVDWRTNASKDGMPANGTYSVEYVRTLDMHRTPIQKQPEMLLCMVGISRIYYLGDEVYPTFHYDDDREMDMFSLIRAPNPTKVKTGSRPRVPHEVPLLTLTATRVIEMDEPAAEASGRGTAAPEVPPPEDVPTTTVPGADQAVETVAAEPPAD
nr:methyltransferase FkbM [Tanacetum cinerariifolium]